MIDSISAKKRKHHGRNGHRGCHYCHCHNFHCSPGRYGHHGLHNGHQDIVWQLKKTLSHCWAINWGFKKVDFLCWALFEWVFFFWALKNPLKVLPKLYCLWLNAEAHSLIVLLKTSLSWYHINLFLIYWPRQNRILTQSKTFLTMNLSIKNIVNIETFLAMRQLRTPCWSLDREPKQKTWAFWATLYLSRWKSSSTSTSVSMPESV